MATPNMSLVVPTINVTPGPAWAQSVNSDLGTIDSHNHSAGRGALVPAAGLDINQALSFQGNDAADLRTARFIGQVGSLSSSADIRCLYVVGSELYYNDGVNPPLAITNNGVLNAAAIGGGIGGQYGTGGSSVFYLSSPQAYYFTANGSTVPGSIDAGEVTVREAGAVSPNGIKIKSPSGLAAPYDLTLPSALPAQPTILTLDNAGNVAPAYTVDNASIAVSSATLQVKASGVQGSMLASTVVDNSSLQLSASKLSVKPSGVAASMLGADVLAQLIPPGTVLPYAGSTAPAGFLLCTGSSVSQAAYPALFAVIGTTYGTGSGAGQFSLPDTRGRSVLGAGQGTGLTNRTLATKLGEETHQLTVGELAAHNHTTSVGTESATHSHADAGHGHGAHNHTDTGHSHNPAVMGIPGYGDLGDGNNAFSGGGGAAPFGVGGDTYGTNSGHAVITSTTIATGQANIGTESATHNHAVTVNSNGSSTAHNNIQPSLVLNHIIKT